MCGLLRASPLAIQKEFQREIEKRNDLVQEIRRLNWEIEQARGEKATSEWTCVAVCMNWLHPGGGHRVTSADKEKAVELVMRECEHEGEKCRLWGCYHPSPKRVDELTQALNQLIQKKNAVDTALVTAKRRERSGKAKLSK